MVYICTEYSKQDLGRSQKVRPLIIVSCAIYVEDSTPWPGPTQGLGSLPPTN